MVKMYSYDEIDSMPRDGTWIECADGLPPFGREVIVERPDGRVTALSRFCPYEGARWNDYHWDNNYGKGKGHTAEGVVRWQPMPLPMAPQVVEGGQERN